MKTLLNATVVDTVPLSQSLDEELGLLDDLNGDDDEEDENDEQDIAI